MEGLRKSKITTSNMMELIRQLDEAEQECNKPELKDFSKVEDILSKGCKELYKSLDAEHKRAFWRSFISSIEINWTTEVKEIKKVNFFNNDMVVIERFRMDDDS